jgi:hypothetical protein
MLTVVFAVLPALSVAVPVTICCSPLLEIATGNEQDAMPLILSEQVNVTVTFELFQPATLAGGAAVPVITGGTLSNVTLTDNVAVLPARSAAATLT